MSFKYPGSTVATLARWNRWGTADLDPRVARDVTDEIAPFLDTPEVVALVGPRRAGKTTVMHQLIARLAKAGVPAEAVLHVNLEEPAFSPDLGADLLEGLYNAYREEVFPEGRAYLFLDEVQHVPDWERWVRARRETDDVKVFVTGSSSALMSRELGTLLTGRHVTFRVGPLSFAELLRFRSIAPPRNPKLVSAPAKLRSALAEYLRWGGFPEVVLAEDGERKELLLKQYFDDVLFKDIALRHRVRDVSTLRAIAVHLLSQTANLVSFQRLSKTFGVSLDLAKAYCSHLAEAFLVSFAPFFSLKVTERQRHPHKVHAVDTGLRNAVCLSTSPDRGRLAETAVFAALDRAFPGDLYYWHGQREIDVLLRLGNRVAALLQVAIEGLDDARVLAREIAALEEGGARYSKSRRLLVTGATPRGSKPGKTDLIPLWRFLLDPARYAES